MQKRLLDLLRGTADAVPGDYVLALIATVLLMIVVIAGAVF